MEIKERLMYVIVGGRLVTYDLYYVKGNMLVDLVESEIKFRVTTEDIGLAAYRAGVTAYEV